MAIAGPRGMARAARYWHTLRHLRPVQFYRRLWFRLARPQPVLDPPPPRRAPACAWTTPAPCRPSLVGPGRFRFLNEEHALDAIGWDNPGIAKLWRYNQHYFADLVAQDGPARAAWHHALLDDWLARNPPARGSGWEPYPLSLRLVNVIKWVLAGGVPSPALVESLAVQARWLERRIEWHLLANHLFVNGKALLFAGLFFTGEEADRWRRKGAAILARELDEQILRDGAQFELSPMYHVLALEDVLDVVNLIRWSGIDDGAGLLARFAERAEPMQHWLRAMCHPDGEVAQFNDAAFGIAPTPAAMLAYADRLGLADPTLLRAAEWLEASGYVRLTAGDAVLIADVATVGPAYQAGHAHADTLAFELSIGAQRVIVNGGTSVYGTDAERLHQRGTPAHSTVTIDGRNSSDVWGGFRVGRRARPFEARVAVEDGVLIAAGAHDGYTGLPGRPIHRRSWHLAAGSLRIDDAIGVTNLPAEARFHCHPDVSVDLDGACDGHITLPGGRRIRFRAQGASVTLEQGNWHPEFGVALPNACLAVRLDRGRACLDLDWN